MQSNENAVVVYPCGRLSGEIRLQGAKNSVLPIMAAQQRSIGTSQLP
jgi:UDP-N-acetylglucosamine enolpyruvyl transferase